MGRLVINQNLASLDNYQKLKNICPFGAFEYVNGNIQINSACKTCKLCVRRGPEGLVSFVEEDAKILIDKSKWRGIAVYIELELDNVHPVSYELIGKARELANKINHPVYAILIASGEQVEKYSHEILEYGVDKLFVYQNDLYNHFNVDRFSSCIENFVEKVKPCAILYGGTSLGRSFAPKIAAHFRTGLTADCTFLDIKENTDLVQVRPAFGGNIMAQIICTRTRPQMSTVRYKVFKMPEKVTPHGEVIYLETKDLQLDSFVSLLSIERKEKCEDISESDVIIACGRAFKSESDLKLAQELSDLLGGTVACTRPLVEAGLMNVHCQIGLSGKTVSPKLIITLGVSGSVQFAAGMKGSEMIVAINSDPSAAIFDIAHYGLVGDIYKIVPKLIELIKNEREKQNV